MIGDTDDYSGLLKWKDVEGLTLEDDMCLSLFKSEGLCKNTRRRIEIKVDGLFGIYGMMLSEKYNSISRIWSDGQMINLKLTERSWDVQVKWNDEKCYLSEGWCEFGEKVGLQMGDLVVLERGNSEYSFSRHIWTNTSMVCTSALNMKQLLLSGRMVTS